MSRGKNIVTEYIKQAIFLLNAEIGILKAKLQYPIQFTEPVSQLSGTGLYLSTKSGDFGKMDMAEIVISIELLHAVLNKDAKPALLTQLAQTFEQIFNFSFGDIYDLKSKIFNRKPYNLTKALDRLRMLMINESKKRDQQNCNAKR
ncbi:MAG: hypothetical protein AB2L20_07440 [Mangrovibacterium sp.]